MNTNVHFSSASDDWATPQDTYDNLNREFAFTLDPCADDINHKTPKYFTKEQNGLEQSWEGERVFCNPPYGRVIGDWVKKCAGGVGHWLWLCYLLGLTHAGSTIIYMARQKCGL